MRKNLKKLFTIALAIVMTLLAINVQPYASASAASDKTIAKKLKKNSWTPLSNPDSASVTRGYALYKIYDAIMDSGVYDDPMWQYVDKTQVLGEDYLDYYNFTKISASSKKQKKAIQWLLKKVDFYDYELIKGTFDGKEVITRQEFCSILSCVINSVFPCWFKVRDTGSSYIDKNGSRWTEPVDFYSQAIFKGCVVGGKLKLDGALTKEDLSKALKNFKIVIANRIKPVYREEKKETMDYGKFIDSLCGYLEKNKDTFRVTDKFYRASDKLGHVYFCGADWFTPCDSEIFINSKHQVTLNTGNTTSDRNSLVMDDRYIDVEKTIEKILKDRFIR